MELAKYLPNLLNCPHKQPSTSSSPNPIFFLDQLTKLLNFPEQQQHTSDQFKRYDMVVFKDGLSDNTETPTSNPFMGNAPNNNNVNQNMQNKETFHSKDQVCRYVSFEYKFC